MFTLSIVVPEESSLGEAAMPVCLSLPSPSQPGALVGPAIPWYYIVMFSDFYWTRAVIDVLSMDEYSIGSCPSVLYRLHPNHPQTHTRAICKVLTKTGATRMVPKFIEPQRQISDRWMVVPVTGDDSFQESPPLDPTNGHLDRTFVIARVELINGTTLPFAGQKKYTLDTK